MQSEGNGMFILPDALNYFVHDGAEILHKCVAPLKI